ncbi:LAME_0D01882g1_1 [Lachancea meyersii CBS 8951]|uniref:type II protein arginine methyltransferase n=1 Tax=Lachancea meyersii CBS 8951 TaxID=1266667 RepID=A0A1G4J742_9SACH|nr:LAME_0D01882g1_1 [Lachancea meyersii CBS 8951]
MAFHRVFKRVLIHKYHTLPLLDTNELVLKGVPYEGTAAGRDYMEWVSIRQQARNKFFSPRERIEGRALPSISLYDDILAHCMARWLLVDYKLNAYPYFDLNIMTVYTDLHQSLRFSRLMLNYFEQTVPEELYQRINCFLVPLHSNTSVTVSVPDTKITAVQDGLLSFQPSIRIEDPIYIMMVNDVLRHLSQDYVRKSAHGDWEQRFVDFLPNGERYERFSKEIDYRCNVTLKTLKPALEASGISETYIPSRLVHFFTLLQQCAPEHKILALDAARREPSSLSSIISSWFRSNDNRFQAFEPNGPTDPLSLEDATSFTSKFSEVRKIYASVHDGSKICQSQGLSDFAESWLDLEETERILGAKDLELRASWMRDAELDVLYN